MTKSATIRFGLTWVLILALLALAGCGGTKTAEQPPAPAAPEPQERVVKHAMGETKVPANPKRVVVLDTGELDTALALGIKPVGAVTVFQDGNFPGYLKGKTDGITKVGTITQPNLETIASLQPDLILSSKRRHKDIYDKLSVIAPTVFSEDLGVFWKDSFMLHADALNKKAEADKLMSDYYKRMDEFKAKMGDKLAKTEVSIIRGNATETRIMMKASFIGTVIQDAGLPRPKSQDKDVFMEKASEELIPQLDASVMFVTHFRPADGGETQAEKLAKHPLWSQLNVVKSGQVYQVDDDYWMLGIGILAANKVVDDLFKHLVK